MVNEYRKWKIWNQYSEKKGKAGKQSMKLREKIMTAAPDGGLYIPPEVLQKMGIEPRAQIYLCTRPEKKAESGPTRLLPSAAAWPSVESRLWRAEGMACLYQCQAGSRGRL